MISIIVPIYKVESFIHQCVDSIIAQTYKNIEIILVDDGSPDDCPAICDKYAKNDSRVKVIHKDNGGLISARKAGLKVSEGEYVCFVDGDDWIESDMYENVAKAIEETNADCIITQFLYSYPDKEQKSDYKLNKSLYKRDEIEKEIFPTMLFDNQYYRFGIFPNCWTKVFKRELLEKHLMDTDDRIRMGEDIAFTYPCLMECQTISFVDKALYHYRINPKSMTKAYDPILHEIIYLPYYTLVKKSEKLGIDLSAQLPYYLLYLVNFVIRNEANANNPKSKEEKKAVLDEIVENDELVSVMDKIDTVLLPSHTKLLYLSIKKRSRFMLQNYIKLLRKFL
ncbi:MAG: glycosyltransferase family 2 protein [Eubacterium sp.]